MAFKKPVYYLKKRKASAIAETFLPPYEKYTHYKIKYLLLSENKITVKKNFKIHKLLY